MKKRVLLINDNPRGALLEEAFKKRGIPLDLVIAERTSDAKQWLSFAHTLDIVFMDYDMGEGEGNNTVMSGLVKAWVDAGFGEHGKPLVASSQQFNQELLAAGCSHWTSWVNLDALLRQLFEH